MGEVKFYRCEKCGNIITKIIDGGPIPFCCGEKMVELIADSSDGAVEKHYIQWICLHTEKGLQFVNLKPGDAPEAVFALAPDDAVIEAFDYCNIHGLWVSKL